MAQMPNFQSAAPSFDPYSMLTQIQGLQRYQEQDDQKKKQTKQQEMLAAVAQEAPDDPDSWVTMLNQRGAPDLALNLQSSLLKTRQEQAALQKTQLENTLTRFERGSAIASSITDEPSFQRGRMLIAQTLGPELANHLGEQYDPAVVQQATQWGTTETGRLAAQRDAMSAYQEALKLEASNKRDAPETAKKWTEAVGQMLSVARNPEEWTQLMQMAKVSGAPPAILAAMPPEFTPEAPQLAAALAMSPDQRAQAADRQTGFGLTRSSQAETARHNRSMESRTGATAPVAVMGPDGKPIYVAPQNAIGQRPASTREQGRPVTSGDASRFAELQTSIDDLSVLRRTLRGTPEAPVPAGATGTDAQIGASLPNWVTNMTGWGTDAKKRQAVIDRVKQVIGKALEGGVLRKEDEIKYEKILPTISDPPDVAETKLQGLEQAIGLRLERELEARGDAGYDTSAFLSRRAGGGEGPGGGMVTLRAPDGSQSQVPADQADHYVRLGATRVR